MKDDPFWQVPRNHFQTTVSDVELPMFFYGVAVRQLNYFVPLDRVTPLMAGTGLIPCRFFNGKALVSLIFYQYQDVSIGPYDEVTITILCRPEMLPDPGRYLPNLLRRHGRDWTIGAYVLEMPVTLNRARAAGREIWGFPKFETTIPFRLGERGFEFGVNDPDGDPILRLSAGHWPGIPMAGFDLVTYSNYQDKIWKTIIDVEVKYENCLPRGVSLTVGPSRHGMAERLRALGLADLRPWVIQISDRFRSRLNVGQPVADWATPPLAYPPEDGGR